VSVINPTSEASKMDQFTEQHKGFRDGKICPCCREVTRKRKANRLARRRLAQKTAKEIRSEINVYWGDK
jgi:hypothetical protein